MTTAGPHRTRAQIFIVASVAFAAFMCTLDSSIVNISLPAIGHYFDVSTGAVSWVVLAYLLVIASLLLPAGRLGDVLGLKRTFLLGYGLFVAGSLLCGLAPTLAVLIAARCCQGMGSALLVATAYAIIPRLMPRAVTGWAFGMVSTASALGVTCGAPLGGLITGLASWRWIFLINVPVGAVAVFAASRSLPADSGQDRKVSLGAFDLPGATLGAAGVLALLLALNLGQEAGWTSAPILAAFGAVAVLVPAFIVWERRQPAPVFDFSLLTNRTFTMGVLASGLMFSAYAGNVFMMPFYLELGKHLSTERVGPVLMVLSVVMMIVGPNAGRLSDRVPPRSLTTAGTGLAACTVAVFAFAFGEPGLWVPVTYLLLLGVSFGMFLSPNNSQVMSLAPADRPGAASGLLTTVNNLSNALGICVMETVFSLRLPAGHTIQELRTATDPVSLRPLAVGYRAALLTVACLCAAACLLSAFVKARRRPGSEPPGAVG